MRALGALVIGMWSRVAEVSIGKSRLDPPKSLRRAAAGNIEVFLDRCGDGRQG
jgi:hypothetical protein